MARKPTKTAIPTFIPPMLATLVAAPFDDPDWQFEVKWDGFRVEALVGGDAVQIQTRGDQDAGRYFGSFLEPPTWIAASGAIVDRRSSHSTTAANPTSRSSRPGSRVAAVSPRNRHRSSTRSSTCSSSTGGRSSTSPSTSAGASSPRCSGRTRASG